MNPTLAFIFFAYGLAFFSMGLLIVLEVSRGPEARLRHALRPLAGFGLFHAAHEWLDMFKVMGYKVIVRRSRMTMLPTLKDMRDALQSLLYNVGLRKQRAQGDRYTFEEKAEYWALIWGTAIMALTGFMMWNPILTTHLLPGQVIPAAKAAHGAEAVLAVLAIILWHMYGVHLKRFNKSMWTGTMTDEEMIHEHPLELADLKAGTAQVALDPKTLRRRRRVYFPIAGILAAGMLAGLLYFVSYEKTAIETVPPAVDVPIYAPQTPTAAATASIASAATTEPTTAAPATVSWQNTISPLLAKQCVMCHGAVNPASGLSLVSYQTALAGGAGGPGIVPGDPATSRLVIVQSAGGHPGQLTPDELTCSKPGLKQARQKSDSGRPR